MTYEEANRFHEIASKAYHRRRAQLRAMLQYMDAYVYVDKRDAIDHAYYKRTEMISRKWMGLK